MWLTIFSVFSGIASIAGLAIGIYFGLFRAARDQGAVEIRVSTFPIRQAEQLTSAFGRRLKFTFDEHPLNEASIVEAILINHSGEVLRQVDFETPFTISTEKASILDYEVLERQPEDLNIHLTRKDDRTLEFSEAIFRDGESLTADSG